MSWLKSTLRQAAEADNVVTLPQPSGPPPALLTLWRDIEAQMTALRIKREKRDEFALRTQQAIESAQQSLARAEREIAEDEAALAEARERWRMMTAPLGVYEEGETS